MLGFGDRLSVDQAALVNGAMAHALDYEDAFDPVPLHPNASLLPAALACADAFGCTGREFLAAVILGCDLVCRMGLALREPMERLGWYPPPLSAPLVRRSLRHASCASRHASCVTPGRCSCVRTAVQVRSNSPRLDVASRSRSVSGARGRVVRATRLSRRARIRCPAGGTGRLLSAVRRRRL